MPTLIHLRLIGWSTLKLYIWLWVLPVSVERLYVEGLHGVGWDEGSLASVSPWQPLLFKPLIQNYNRLTLSLFLSTAQKRWSVWSENWSRWWGARCLHFQLLPQNKWTTRRLDRSLTGSFCLWRASVNVMYSIFALVTNSLFEFDVVLTSCACSGLKNRTEKNVNLCRCKHWNNLITTELNL